MELETESQSNIDSKSRDKALNLFLGELDRRLIYNALHINHAEEEKYADGQWREFSDENSIDTLLESLEGKGTKWRISEDDESLYKGPKGYGTGNHEYGYASIGREALEEDFKRGFSYHILYSDKQDPLCFVKVKENEAIQVRVKGDDIELAMDISETLKRFLLSSRLTMNETVQRNLVHTITLSGIARKLENGESLTRDELAFIYGIDKKPATFVAIKETKAYIGRIKRQRKRKGMETEDLATIFSCDEQNVALGRNELDENTNVLVLGPYHQIAKKIRLNPKFYPNLKAVIGKIELEGDNTNNILYLNGEFHRRYETKNNIPHIKGMEKIQLPEGETSVIYHHDIHNTLIK